MPGGGERSCRRRAGSCRACCAAICFSLPRCGCAREDFNGCRCGSCALAIGRTGGSGAHPDLVARAQYRRDRRGHSNRSCAGASLSRHGEEFIRSDAGESGRTSTEAAMKWLLQNVRRRAGFAFKNPRYALGAMFRELTLADEKFLARVTASSPRQIRGYLDEPITTPAFAEHLRGADKQFRALSVESADLFAKKILNQYAAARALAPDCIVETGVANGVSSSYLLLALQKNGRGRLRSIGLPEPPVLSP